MWYNRRLLALDRSKKLNDARDCRRKKEKEICFSVTFLAEARRSLCKALCICVEKFRARYIRHDIRLFYSFRNLFVIPLKNSQYSASRQNALLNIPNRYY